MSMASLNISLPQSLKDFVEHRVKEVGCSTPSEYLRTLVREDRKRRAQEKLEALLLEGLNSGEPVEVNEGFWKEMRQELAKRYRHGRKRERR